MNSKKVVAFTTALLLCCAGSAMPNVISTLQPVLTASAVSNDSGSCGTNCTYYFNSYTGTLTISGSGDMANYSSAPEVPWYSYRSKIKNIIIGKNITSVGDCSFYYCTSATSVEISNSVTSIGEKAFYNCTALESIDMPDSVTSIGEWAFYNCRLKSITIPSKVVSIARYAFYECTFLESVTISNGVTSIDSNTFYGCTALNKITIPNSVTYIGGKAFYNCTSLKSVTIPNGVTSIGINTFYNCTSLTNVTIPDSVKSIGDGAFENCKALTSANIPYGVTCLKDSTFYSCASLKTVTIPNSVKYIESNAFSNCLSLTSITIPNSVTSIGESAFFNCKSLKNVTIPDSVTSIESNAFCSCSSLTSITIPDGLTSIGYCAFYYCIALESVTIPNSVTSIGKNAFYECSGLTDVYFTGDREDWETIRTSDGNSYLYSATLHLNYAPQPTETIVTTVDPTVTAETTTTTVTTTTEATTTTTTPTTTTVTTTTSATTTTEPPVTTTVTTTTELPETTTGENKELVFGEDNWAFNNSSRYFKSSKYYISNSYYKDLLSKLSNTEKKSIEKYIETPWIGSCYGLALLSVLAKENIFDVSQWQDGAEYLHDVNAPHLDDTESLINYYFLTQLTTETQQIYSKTALLNEDSKLQTLIDLCSQVEDGGTPVILGFSGKFYGKSQGGHAVVAYGVEYGSWIKNGVAYNGRVLIYDNNELDFNDSTCLYFNTTSNRWAIPEYEITSTNGGTINFLSNDLSILNNKGYFSSDSYVNIDNYIAVLKSAAITADCSIQKINKSVNGNSWVVNNSTSSDDIKIFYDCYDDVTQSSPNFKVALQDANSAWQFVLDDTDTIDLDMSYENSLLSVSADTATSAKFSPDGFIEVDAVDSDFKMGIVYNDGYYTLPWYNVTVDGHHSNVASMTKTDDGIILYGDNLVNVTVSANNDDYSIGTNFSTTANSVLIYDIDDYTIGIAIDEDGDGTYETDTPIAQTEHNGDMNYDGTVDSLDLLLMKQSILGESKIMGDLNLDGTTNIIDLIILKQKLLES